MKNVNAKESCIVVERRARRINVLYEQAMNFSVHNDNLVPRVLSYSAPVARERERERDPGLVTCLDEEKKFLGGVSSIEPFVALCFCLSQNEAVTIERFAPPSNHLFVIC